MAQNKDVGHFIDLPGAEEGKVVVRFPPEASGYLHIGHSKAALLNLYYKRKYKGIMIMRFDDTNPSKENSLFEQAILEDLAVLGVDYDTLSHTSDHFDALLEYCTSMISAGTAYVDDTEPELMKLERLKRIESKSRHNSVEKNEQLWADMVAGAEGANKLCVRAKINMSHMNGCMRDPTLYRYKEDIHVRTGSQYRVYPTYDFACPIVDSIEGVTHALRTTEYHDRDEQYAWILETLGLRIPRIYEYGKISFIRTVMSKRKLTWFVEEGLVQGWDDPRFPTIRGIFRRGLTLQGLWDFITAQGSSTASVMMGWEKLWALNRKVIDPISPRFTALVKADLAILKLNQELEEKRVVPLHPNNSTVGTKIVPYDSEMYVERVDVSSLQVGEKLTLLNYGNCIVTAINPEAKSDEVFIHVDSKLEDTDYKNTVRVTWVSRRSTVGVTCQFYDDLLTVDSVPPDGDFKNFVNRDSRREGEYIGENAMGEVKRGDILQIMKKGYYICDQQASVDERRGCTLIAIPDGHSKKLATGGKKPAKTNGGVSKGKKGNGKAAGLKDIADVK